MEPQSTIHSSASSYSINSRDSTPVPRSTASPSPAGISTPSSIKSSSSSSQKQKPVNVFSDDGSFLERFQRIKKEEDERKQQEEKMALKREFELRFKRRGKRRAPSPEPPKSTETTDEVSPIKKPRVEDQEKKPLTAYEKEMQSYTGSLKDTGTGIRPLVK